MKKTENLTILMLLVVACILTAMVVGTYVGTGSSASGASVAESKMDYIMVTYTIDQAQDLLCLIDCGCQKLKVYGWNLNTKTVDLVTENDLERDFQSH